MPTFRIFLEVLRDTFHGWIADELLDSQINISETSLLQKTVPVRSLIENRKEANIRDPKPPPFVKHITTPYIPEAPYPYYQPGCIVAPNTFLVNSPSGMIHAYRAHESRHNRRGRASPITQVPENLRELQKTFDHETATARKSLAALKQEEVTIKALLQQNLRHQQDMLTKQEALTEVRTKIKQINDTTSQILKPEVNVSQTRKRLSALQRVPWDV